MESMTYLRNSKCGTLIVKKLWHSPTGNVKFAEWNERKRLADDFEPNIMKDVFESFHN